MENFDLSLIDTDEYEFALPESLSDDHPLTDPYYENLRLMQRALHAQFQRLPPKIQETVRLVATGMTHLEAAQRLNVKPATISRRLKDPQARKTLSQLRAVQAYQSGPTVELKQNVLWNIVQETRAEQPKTAILAIQELNRMAGVYDTEKDSKIQIIIHNDLQRGALDIEHK